MKLNNQMKNMQISEIVSSAKVDVILKLEAFYTFLKGNIKHQSNGKCLITSE